MKNTTVIALVLLVIVLTFAFIPIAIKMDNKNRVKNNIQEYYDPAGNPMNTTSSTAITWQTNNQGNSAEGQPLNQLDMVIDYGANVYYFPETQDHFASALAGFLLNNTNLEVTAMTGNVVRQNRGKIEYKDDNDHRSDYGAAIGYFVTFREKK
ncbi:MAG: hypothetical protein KGJ35_02730 [Patescibacteria group bacterium]|nr:hypothetical protein [Patescibacteria group bacterium]